MALGFDCGTFNLVCCNRTADGNVKNIKEVNAFLKMPLENNMVYNMMRKEKVPLIDYPEDGCVYALGEVAANFAYTMNVEMKRPMKDGCVNPTEKAAQSIISMMIHGMLSEMVKTDKEVLYYSVPANAVNETTDSDYHQKVLQSIFRDFNIGEDGNPTGPTVNAQPINEGLALIYAELLSSGYTGMGISFGAGMVNLCFALQAMPLFQFSIVNSGDWIDKMASKAVGENPTFVNKEKLKTNLTEVPSTMVQRAIHAQYEIMLEHTAKCIKEGLEKVGNKVRTNGPVNIVVAGGTSLPVGFDKKFGEILKASKLSIEVGDIIRPKDPLYSVARGCLVAAENATQ